MFIPVSNDTKIIFKNRPRNSRVIVEKSGNLSYNMGHSVLVRILNLDFFIRLQLRCHTLYIMQLLLLMYYTKYSVCKYNYQTLSTSPVLSCVISDIFIALTFQLILVTYGSAVWISGTGTGAALCTEIALCF